MKKRLSTHNIIPSWTDEEKEACGNILVSFLTTHPPLSNTFEDTLHVQNVRDFEDRLEFTVSPFPQSYPPSFLAKLDSEVQKTLPGFSVKLRQDARTHTFISPENRDETFKATTYTDALAPCFVYRRKRISDPFLLFVGVFVLVVFILWYLSVFRWIYHEEGYTMSAALSEVSKAFFSS